MPCSCRMYTVSRNTSPETDPAAPQDPRDDHQQTSTSTGQLIGDVGMIRGRGGGGVPSYRWRCESSSVNTKGGTLLHEHTLHRRVKPEREGGH